MVLTNDKNMHRSLTHTLLEKRSDVEGYVRDILAKRLGAKNRYKAPVSEGALRCSRHSQRPVGWTRVEEETPEMR